MSLFYPPRNPADTFLRMWVPFMALLTGSIAMAWKTALILAREYIKGLANGPEEPLLRRVQGSWPLVAAAIITGYILQMMLAGGEQLVVMAEHMQNRLPLKVCNCQTRALMSSARARDKVLYESMMLMNCYFIRGALDLGAVYYHPELKGSPSEKEWLMRPDIRFAVAYNPLAIHPSLAHLHERLWGTTSPDFYFSPLMKPQRHGPILHEDGIRVSGYKYIDVEWRKEDCPRRFTVTVENQGPPCPMKISPVDDFGRVLEDRTMSRSVLGPSSSWLVKEVVDLRSRIGGPKPTAVNLTVNLAPMKDVDRLRLYFPSRGYGVKIVGLRFDSSPFNWPWDHKARLTVTDNSWEIGPMNFSFDPQKLLPEQLQQHPVRVIDDCGSSVLLEIMPSGNITK